MDEIGYYKKHWLEPFTLDEKTVLVPTGKNYIPLYTVDKINYTINCKELDIYIENYSYDEIIVEWYNELKKVYYESDEYKNFILLIYKPQFLQ